MIDQAEYYTGCINEALRKINNLKGLVVRCRIEAILKKEFIYRDITDIEREKYLEEVERLIMFIDETRQILESLRDCSIKTEDFEVKKDFVFMINDYLYGVFLQKSGLELSGICLVMNGLNVVKKALKKCQIAFAKI